MAKDKAHCKQIVKETVRDNFPDTVAAMLSGSVADGNSNETSDIDAVLFSNWHKGAFVDNYEYKGENVQVTMLPVMNMGNLSTTNSARAMEPYCQSWQKAKDAAKRNKTAMRA